MSDNLPSVARTPALVTLAERFPILDSSSNRELEQTYNDNIGPHGLTDQELEKIKVPSGGSTVWKVSTPDGDEHPKELTGIIMAHRTIRLYYRTPYDQRGKKAGPPDCRSLDGFWGEGDPGGECHKCPFAQYGTDPKGKRGQACKEMRQLAFLREGHNLPNIVPVPPTSLKNMRQYLNRLYDYNINHAGVVTTLRLECVQNPDGIDYSRIVPTASTRLSPEERAVLRPFKEKMESLLKPLEVEGTEYIEIEAEGNPPEQYEGGPREG
jgi:hypothetical protein